MRRMVPLFLLWMVGGAGLAIGQGSMSQAQKATLIRSALSAGPRSITDHAAVMAPDADGKMITLREGTNGWTCVPDDPKTPRPDPVCMDAQAMKWGEAFNAHAAKPANTEPGIMYMLAGGSDPSASDPAATTTKHWVIEPPHWMIMWPVDPKASGLSTKPKMTGSWIMWAGTPWAHIMINQKP